LVTAALVCAGCYLGATAAVWLRFPGAGSAIVFPPYAILTAALCRSRPGRWWILLLAASAGNLLAHQQGGFAVAFALGAELANNLRAILAAVGLRHSARRPGRFDTMGEMVAFLIFAVFLAPAASAFVGAGLAMAHGSTYGFWLVWQEWMLSNAITGLTLLPVLLARRPSWSAVISVPPRHRVEASLLVVWLLVVGAGVFMVPYAQFSPHPARLYWPLPFLLWAAVRFGPRGTSAALLDVTALSIWGALQRRGPFVAQSPAENLLELQLFLLAVSVPVLLLSALLRQQRHTALALWESRRQYRSVVEDQTEMICRYAPDGTYTFVNAAYCSTFGRRAPELLGGNIWSLVPAGVHRTSRELSDAITPASPVATRELRLSLREGGTRWLQWRDRGFFDARGVVVEYQSVGRDISDRKQAEDERRQLEAQRSVEAALREADRRKDEFLAMLGHELRNPLAPIPLALEIMRLAPPRSPEAAWASEAIERQVHHLTRLVDDLLDISRVAVGQIRLEIGPLDLATVVAHAVDTTRPLIDSFRHELTVVLPDGPLRLRGDAVRLTQVVANLLNNAAKYTEPGGRIHLSVQREAGRVSLSVQDNGIGIAPDELGRIFDLFTQTAAARERAQGGLGIGLTIVKRLVEIHDGTVEARSDGAHKGTEIIVRLPIEEDAISGDGSQV
jgi:PAS domain S-box-containing protein